MIIFLQSLESHVTKATTKLCIHPDDDEDTCYKIMVEEFEDNAKIHYALFQALNDDDIYRVINCTPAYDICQCLIIKHEGTTQVKKSKN